MYLVSWNPKEGVLHFELKWNLAIARQNDVLSTIARIFYPLYPWSSNSEGQNTDAKTVDNKYWLKRL